MSTQRIFIQQFARLFHHHHEVLHSEAETLNTTQRSEDHIRLTAAARNAILDLGTSAWLGNDRKRYFAKPGEAEWGC